MRCKRVVIHAYGVSFHQDALAHRQKLTLELAVNLTKTVFSDLPPFSRHPADALHCLADGFHGKHRNQRHGKQDNPQSIFQNVFQSQRDALYLVFKSSCRC